MNGVWPGQSIGTLRSRGNESSEIVFSPGSARTSISVSERDGVFFPSSARWSYPSTSAVAGSPGNAISRDLSAFFTSSDRGATAATVSWR